MKIRKSAEDYLETILILKAKLGNVHAVDIANELQFSKPSVSIAVHSLDEAGYIVIDDHGHIDLTLKGHQVADAIYERHVLLTELFMKLGVSEEQAATDACKVEHDLSEETFTAIKKHANRSTK